MFSWWLVLRSLSSEIWRRIISYKCTTLHCLKHQGRVMMMKAKLSSEMKAYIHQTKERHIPDL